MTSVTPSMEMLKMELCKNYKNTNGKVLLMTLQHMTWKCFPPAQNDEFKMQNFEKFDNVIIRLSP